MKRIAHLRPRIPKGAQLLRKCQEWGHRGQVLKNTPEPKRASVPASALHHPQALIYWVFRGRWEQHARAARAQASRAPPMHPQDWNIFLGYFKGVFTTPEPKSPSVIASAHASPRVEMHCQVHKGSVEGEGFLSLRPSFPPAKSHPTTYFYYYFFKL